MTRWLNKHSQQLMGAWVMQRGSKWERERMAWKRERGMETWVPGADCDGGMIECCGENQKWNEEKQAWKRSGRKRWRQQGGGKQQGETGVSKMWNGGMSKNKDGRLKAGEGSNWNQKESGIREGWVNTAAGRKKGRRVKKMAGENFARATSCQSRKTVVGQPDKSRQPGEQVKGNSHQREAVGTNDTWQKTTSRHDEGRQPRQACGQTFKRDEALLF